MNGKKYLHIRMAMVNFCGIPFNTMIQNETSGCKLLTLPGGKESKKNIFYALRKITLNILRAFIFINTSCILK